MAHLEEHGLPFRLVDDAIISGDPRVWHAMQPYIFNEQLNGGHGQDGRQRQG